MTGGTEFSEVQDISKETPEVVEAKQQLDRATIEPAAQLEKVGDVKQSEDLEKEVAAVVEAAPKLETPPAITLEGAGEAGKMTIESATDPVAIIDTNDGAGKVSSGANMDDVLIIDSNDGTSTVGIIDSNDGISAEAIIDTNDTTNRETIGTWPTPETGEQTDKAERENPHPLTDGGDPVSPFHDPVQEVSVADTGTAQIESDTEMSETIAAGTAIGQDELKAGEYDIHFEISGDTPDSGEFSRADVSTVEVDVGVGITTTADDTGQLAGVEAGAIATVEADASTAKTIGTEASQGSGIPIAEGGDTADGASPGGMEVGSVEEAEQIMPETGEDVQESPEFTGEIPKELKETLSPIQKMISRLMTEIDALKTELSTIMNEISGHKAKITEYEAGKEHLARQIEQMEYKFNPQNHPYIYSPGEEYSVEVPVFTDDGILYVTESFYVGNGELGHIYQLLRNSSHQIDTKISEEQGTIDNLKSTLNPIMNQINAERTPN